MTDICLLVVDVPRALEDTIADWLLLDEPARGFTSAHTRGHHSGSEGLSASERVTGHVQRSRFEIECSPGEAQTIVAGLRESFGCADIRFRCIPLLEHGRFDA